MWGFPKTIAPFRGPPILVHVRGPLLLETPIYSAAVYLLESCNRGIDPCSSRPHTIPNKTVYNPQQDTTVYLVHCSILFGIRYCLVGGLYGNNKVKHALMFFPKW